MPAEISEAPRQEEQSSETHHEPTQSSTESLVESIQSTDSHHEMVTPHEEQPDDSFPPPPTPADSPDSCLTNCDSSVCSAPPRLDRSNEAVTTTDDHQHNGSSPTVLEMIDNALAALEPHEATVPQLPSSDEAPSTTLPSDKDQLQPLFPPPSVATPKPPIHPTTARKTIQTTADSATKKFVTFLSNEEGTPISQISKQDYSDDDDKLLGDDIDIQQPLIGEGGIDDDEKKEEVASVLVERAERLVSDEAEEKIDGTIAHSLDRNESDEQREVTLMTSSQISEQTSSSEAAGNQLNEGIAATNVPSPKSANEPLSAILTPTEPLMPLRPSAALFSNETEKSQAPAVPADISSLQTTATEQTLTLLSTPTETTATPLRPSSTASLAPINTAPVTNAQSPSRISYVSPPGRRSITLHLLEEVDATTTKVGKQLTPFKRLNLRRFRSLSLSTVMVPLDEKGVANSTTYDNNQKGPAIIDRGIISVSWYDGTTSSEMQEHVFNCVLRKLRSESGEKKVLEDVRLLDENVVPHEEVVLCPFLPDNSHFLLKFKTSTAQPPPSTKPKHNLDPYNIYHRQYISRAPDSPSAEPSPFPSSANLHGLGNNNLNGQNLGGLSGNAVAQLQQLQLLNAASALLQSNGIKTQNGLYEGLAGLNGLGQNGHHAQRQQQQQQQHLGLLPKLPMLPNVETVPREFREHQPIHSGRDEANNVNVSPNQVEKSPNNANSNNINNNNTDAQIEQQLRQLNELFLLRNGQSTTTTPTNTTSNPQEEDPDPQLYNYYKSQEKKQVIFTIANYFVLFMSLIAISAEIQSRLPQWMAWVQENYDSVQNCATDHDSLYKCISEGNFSGLVASFMLWATQSAAAKRIFLFGFESPKKLWTVVYEALVSAVCWGTSYIFIRRGLNPNTRERFIQKYWKDAVYGSLAGFNAAFMKAVLKNLVPQDVALQAIETRQLKVFKWLGMLMSEE